MKPREYQEKYLDDIKRGEKNLAHLATGGGKSVIFLNYIKDCIKDDRPVLFIVHGNSILDQAIKKYFFNYDVSKMQGSNKWRMSKVLACSIDTLTRKDHGQLKRLFEYYKDIVVDECHNCTAEKYKKVLPNKEDKNFTVVGLTATPYAIGKKGHTYWTHYIKHISVAELVRQGYLVTPRCFSAKLQMDTKVKKTAGEFNNKALFQKNDSLMIYSSITEEYLNKAENMPALCFAMNLDHSRKIAKQFNEVGIKAIHADADTCLEERAEIIQGYEEGYYKLICNVNIFSTGVDIPIAQAGIMARPTNSRTLWIQQVGRVLRPAENKKFAIILDHGGNVERCGHPMEDFEAVLNDNEGDKDPVVKVDQCGFCFFFLSAKQKECPSCGYSNFKLIERKMRKIKQDEDRKLQAVQYKSLAEREKEKIEPWENMKKWYLGDPLKELLSNNFTYERPWNYSELENIAHIISRAFKKNHKPNSVYFKIYDQYPETNYLKFPKWFLKIKADEQ